MNNNKTPKKINQSELLELLLSVTKPTFVNIKSKTKVRMNKTGNPYFDQVTKIVSGNYFIGGTYEDMVNERMKKEGLTPTFVSEECTIGQHISKCIQFNEERGRNYLQYFIFDNSIHSVEYEFEGNYIDRELFRSFEVKKSQSSRQPQDNKHKPQSFMLESIVGISLFGEVYEIE